MIYSIEELRREVGNIDVNEFLINGSVEHILVGEGGNQLVYIKDKLRFKSINDIEEVLKKDYKILDVSELDGAVMLVKEIYLNNMYVSIEEAKRYGGLVNKLVDKGVLSVSDYNNSIEVSYKLLAKVLLI